MVTNYLSYKLSDEFVKTYEDKKVNWGLKDAGGTSLSELIFLIKYSRKKEDGSKETWQDVCRRVTEGTYSIQKDWAKTNHLPWNDHKAARSAQEFFDRMFAFKFTPPGRGLQNMGSEMVNGKGYSTALQNCGAVALGNLPKNNPGEPFSFLMSASMMGVGIGYSTIGVDKTEIRVQPVCASKEEALNYIVPDSREGWAESVRLLINSFLIPNQKYIEFDYSQIRPKGEPIKSFGTKAPGPQPLIDLHIKLSQIYDRRVGDQIDSDLLMDTANLIGKCVVSGNTRRSALLAYGDLENKNFLAFKDWTQNHERTQGNGWAHASNNSVRAFADSDLSSIIPGIALNGEPGVIWEDTVKTRGRLKDDPDNKDAKFVCFNPCQPEWATVLTERGLSTIGNTVVGDRIWSEDGWVTVTNKWSTGIKPVLRYSTTAGFVDCTENHRVVSDGVKVEAKDASSLDRLPGNAVEANDFDTDIIMSGLLIGDGYLHPSSTHSAILIIGENDQDYFDSEISHLLISKMGGTQGAWHVKTELDSYELSPRVFDRCIPNRHLHGTEKQIRSFLRGLYSANGSVVRERITLKTTNFELMREAQIALSSLGIVSYYTTNKPSRIKWDNGEYESRESYDLNITGAHNREIFASSIGFIQQSKMTKLQTSLANTQKSMKPAKISFDVKDVEYLGDYEVYDITVSGNHHTYWTNGMNVSNCAEQPLEDREFCTLADVYVNNHEDFEDFKRTLKFAFLYAKTVTLLPTHFERSNAVMQRNRRIGLSLSGITDFIDSRQNGLQRVRDWFDRGYDVVRYYDHEYSEWLCVRESNRVTTIKPGGTTGLVASTSSGIHWTDGGEYYLRALRVGNDEPFLPALRLSGHKVEADLMDTENTSVVYFPIKSRAKRSAKHVSLFEKAALAVEAQRLWSDNSVSVTLTFDAENEAKDVGTVLNMYAGQLKTVSFLPQGNRVYEQQPYSEITEADYETASFELMPTLLDDLYKFWDGEDVEDAAYCSTDMCEIQDETRGN